MRAPRQTAILLRVRGWRGGDVVGVCDDAMGHVMATQLPVVGHFYDLAGGNDRHHDTCAHSHNFSDRTWAPGASGSGWRANLRVG